MTTTTNEDKTEATSPVTPEQFVEIARLLEEFATQKAEAIAYQSVGSITDSELYERLHHLYREFQQDIGEVILH